MTPDRERMRHRGMTRAVRLDVACARAFMRFERRTRARNVEGACQAYRLYLDLVDVLDRTQQLPLGLA